MPYSSWAPTVAAVGSILRARTFDVNGVEQQTFTTSTRPTAAQVTELIAVAQGDILPDATVVPDVLLGSASRLAALGAALLTELSYFPTEVAQGTSPYAELKVLYDARLKAFQLALADVASGGEPGTEDDIALAQYGFPEDTGGMIGWGFKW